MKRPIRYFIILCVVVNLIFISFIPTYACQPYYRPYNYWYKLDYTVASDSLPSGITAVGNYPPYSMWYEHWEDIHDATLGRLKFTNENDSRAYIVPDSIFYSSAYRESNSRYAQAVDALADELAQDDGQIDLSTFSNTFSDHIIEPNSTRTHSTYETMIALMQNPLSRGGTAPPPPPFLYEQVIIQDNQLFTVPITVSYSLNPHYEKNSYLFYKLIDSYAVALGEVIGASEVPILDGEYPDLDSNDPIEGYARIQVEEWLLGDGPAEIVAGHFGEPCSSDYTQIGDRAYFLLGEPYWPDSILYQVTGGSAEANTVLSANDENRARVEEALQELAESTATTPTALPTEDEPGMSIFLPYISR